MTQNTPGPWHYRARGDGFIVRSKVAQGPVAGVNGSRPIEDAEANARLIAATPDLLEALTRAVEAHGPFGDDTRPAWWADACATIAKATGGAA